MSCTPSRSRERYRTQTPSRSRSPSRSPTPTRSTSHSPTGTALPTDTSAFVPSVPFVALVEHFRLLPTLPGRRRFGHQPF
jgi:hypothetical protein